MNTDYFWQIAGQVITPAVPLLITALVAWLVALYNSNVKNTQFRTAVETATKAAEQKFGADANGAIKKDFAVRLVTQLCPWAKALHVDAAIEAAVLDLPQALTQFSTGVSAPPLVVQAGNVVVPANTPVVVKQADLPQIAPETPLQPPVAQVPTTQPGAPGEPPGASGPFVSPSPGGSTPPSPLVPPGTIPPPQPTIPHG